MKLKRRDDWETPNKLYEYLNERFKFNVDAAASAENAKCEVYFTEADNTLTRTFGPHARIFCNPPYSKAREFAEHLYEQYVKFGAQSILLLPVRTDRIWFHTLRTAKGVQVEWYTGRIHFGGSGKSAFMYNINYVFGFEDVPHVEVIDAGEFNDNGLGSATT